MEVTLWLEYLYTFDFTPVKTVASKSKILSLRGFTYRQGSWFHCQTRIGFRFHTVCEIHSESEMCETPDVDRSIPEA